jgi:hypothetical protein
MTDYKKLFDSVKWQNEILITQYSKLKDLYSTDDQKVRYLFDYIDFYTTITQIMIWVYYILTLVAIYAIFMGVDRGYTTNFKIMLVLLLVIFPLVILPLETFLYWLLRYIYSLITGSVMVQSNVELPGFTFSI